MNFLGSSLTFVLVYVWARRNPFIPMTFLGLFNFSAPFLPWVLLGFSLLLSNSVPYGDVLGIIVGHAYYFLEDVYPGTSGRRPLKTPAWFQHLMEGVGVATPQPVQQLASGAAWNEEAAAPIDNAQPPAELQAPTAPPSSSQLQSISQKEAEFNPNLNAEPIEEKEGQSSEEQEKPRSASSISLKKESRELSPSRAE
jgi:hypothetical protein